MKRCPCLRDNTVGLNIPIPLKSGGTGSLSEVPGELAGARVMFWGTQSQCIETIAMVT